MTNLPVRIIARLDIKGSNLVKGINLEGLRVLGNPGEFAEYYYHQGIDELFYMDVVASLYGRNSLSDMVSNIAKKVFIPLTVGGGIRTIDDINEVLRAGADKVCINTAAIRDPEFIKSAIKKFGSSTIVVAIEAIKQPDGEYLAYVDNGREYTGVEVLDWAKQLDMMGVGEIVITSVDRDGTGSGVDIDLVKIVSNNVRVPVIVHGGVGSVSDAVNVFTNTSVSALAVSSVLHYDYIEHTRQRNIEVNNTEGNINFLKSGAIFSRIKSCKVGDIKLELNKHNVFCRL